MVKILVAEDDEALNKSVCIFLNQNGFETKSCFNGNEAFDALYKNQYDLIISDIMMPEVDGFELAKNIRQINKDIPILFMTAKDDFASKEQGFKTGVDDYMVKPVDLNELLLRVNALLRRAKISATKELTVGNFTMNTEEHTAAINGEEISLTSREFNIIYKFLSYPKKTFSRAQLMDEFWNPESYSGLRTVDVYITKIREKLSECNGFEIVTVHGIGYKAVLNEKE
ncbi:MAG: response regulator transcription factor [Treponema sp.]